LKKVSQRKLAYIRDKSTVLVKKLNNPQYSLAIGKEGYFPVLLAYPINKNYSDSRQKLYEM